MLRQKPEGLSEKLSEIWVKLKPLTIPMLRHYWNKVEPNLPMIDTVNADYCEDSDSKGMKLKSYQASRFALVASVGAYVSVISSQSLPLLPV